ncbi:FAD-dependent oxidoreductase (plasmid) [Pseudomonas luteola]
MFKTWLCLVCGLIYDEAVGWPEDGIEPGTRWEDVPEDWQCPECNVGKADFEMLDISETVAAATSAPLPVVTQAPTATAKAEPVLPAVSEPIVIIGSGHAGYGLAQALRKANSTIDIRVLTQDSGHLYSKPSLSIGLAQGKTDDALAGEPPLSVESRLNIRVHSHCRVDRIDPASKKLYTSLGEIEYGRLVLASGATPISLPIEGDTAELLSVNNLHDYQHFRKRLQQARSIAIIGDGLIGCEFANDLAATGYKVDVIGLGKWPMERLLPLEAGRHLQTALSRLGVDWHLQNTVRSIRADNGRNQLTLANGETVEADLVLSAVGLRPNLTLAETAGLDVGRGIRVDTHLQTSQSDIYALGDCVEIDGQLLPYLAPINQGIQALSKTLLGQPTVVDYPFMPVTVKTPAAPLCFLPPAPGATGTWRCSPTEDGLCAGFYTDEALNGFVLLGRQAQAQRNSWLQTYTKAQQAEAVA